VLFPDKLFDGTEETKPSTTKSRNTKMALVNTKNIVLSTMRFNPETSLTPQLSA